MRRSVPDLEQRQLLGLLVKEPVDLGAAEPIRLFLGFALPVELGEAGLVLAHALGRLFELGLGLSTRRDRRRLDQILGALHRLLVRGLEAILELACRSAATPGPWLCPMPADGGGTASFH
jgi:hypothetical protein